MLLLYLAGWALTYAMMVAYLLEPQRGFAGWVFPLLLILPFGGLVWVYMLPIPEGAQFSSFRWYVLLFFLVYSAMLLRRKLTGREEVKPSEHTPGAPTLPLAPIPTGPFEVSVAVAIGIAIGLLTLRVTTLFDTPTAIRPMDILGMSLLAFIVGIGVSLVVFALSLVRTVPVWFWAFVLTPALARLVLGVPALIGGDASPAFVGLRGLLAGSVGWLFCTYLVLLRILSNKGIEQNARR